MTHVTAVLRQNAFRGRENSGNEATPTWIALANIDWSQEVDSSFRVRFVIQEIANATNPETVTPNLEFSLNGGAYTVIDGTTAVKYAAFVGATDDDATTQQLGAGTFVTGRLDSNGTVTTADLQNSETEYEYCVTLDSALVAAGNTVALRVYNGATAFDQYGQTPTLTAAAAVSERTGTHAADIAPIEGTGTGTAVGVVTGTHAADITAITGTGTAERVITGTDTSSITAITGTGTGALVVEVTGTGAIDSPVPTTAITAEREITSTGAIAAPVVTTTGTAERVITGTDTSSVTAITGAGTGAVSDLLYLRPDADNAIGSWQDQAAGTTNIYQSIDEEVANDTDYVRSETSPVDSVYKVRLSNPTGDGIDPDGLHDIVYRYGKGGDAEELNLIVRLVQGASTIIATWTHLDVAAGFTTATQSLSIGEVATITDYDDLFLEFEGDVAVADAYIVNGFSPPLVADFANATPYYRKADVDTTFADLFTYTGASLKTMMDSAGNLVWAPHNVFLRSEEFDNAQWTKTNVSITANDTTDPDGGSTADLVTASATTSVRHEIRYGTTSVAVVGVKNTFSAYLKAGTGDVQFWLNGGSAEGTNTHVNFDLSAGTIAAGFDVFFTSGTIVDAGGGWYLCSVEFTPLITSGGPFINLIADAATATYASNTGENASCHVWGAHFYRSDLGGMADNPDRGDSYVPTTSAAVYLPRRDAYYGATPTKGGIQIESEARTNLFLNNATLSTQNVTTTAAPHTLHFTGTGTVTLTGTSTAGPLVGTGTGESDRVSLTFTPTAGTLTCTVSGTVSNAQIELGSTTSSVIPTAGSTVARAAETLPIAGADMPYSATNMSLYFNGLMTYADRDITITSNGTTAEVVWYRWYLDSGNNLFGGLNTGGAATGGAFVIDENAGVPDNVSTSSTYYSPGVNVPLNMAARMGSTFVNAAYDGTALTANTTPTALPSLSAVTFELGFNFMGFISEFRFWDADIADAGIEEVTT